MASIFSIIASAIYIAITALTKIFTTPLRVIGILSPKELNPKIVLKTEVAAGITQPTPRSIPQIPPVIISPPEYKQSEDDILARQRAADELAAIEYEKQQQQIAIESEKQRLAQATLEQQRIDNKIATANEAERQRLSQEEHARQQELAEAKALRDYYTQIDGSFVTSGDDYGKVYDGKLNPIKDFAILESCRTKYGGRVLEDKPDIFKTIEKSNNLTFEDCPNIYEDKLVSNGFETALIKNNQKIVFNPTGMMGSMCYQKYGEPILIDGRAMNSFPVSSSTLSFDVCPNTLENKMITIDGSQIGFIKDNKRISLTPSGLFSFYCSRAWGTPYTVPASVFNGFVESQYDITYEDCPNVYDGKLVQSDSGKYGYIIKTDNGYIKRNVSNDLLQNCIKSGDFNQFKNPMKISENLFGLLENGSDMTFDECGSYLDNILIQNKDTGEISYLIKNSNDSFIKRKISSDLRLICKETGTYSQFDVSIPVSNDIYSQIPYGSDMTMNECADSYADVLVQNIITNQLAYIVKEVRDIIVEDPSVDILETETVYIKRIVNNEELRNMCIDSGDYPQFENKPTSISNDIFNALETGKPLEVNECLNAYNNIIIYNRTDNQQKALVKNGFKHPIEYESILDIMCKNVFNIQEVSDFIYNGYPTSNVPITFTDCPNILDGKLINTTNDKWYYIFNNKYRYIPDPALIDLCVESGNFPQFENAISNISEAHILTMENGGNLTSSECPNVFANGTWIMNPSQTQHAYVTLNANSQVIIREINDKSLLDQNCFGSKQYKVISQRLYDYFKKSRGADMTAYDCREYLENKVVKTTSNKYYWITSAKKQYIPNDIFIHFCTKNPNLANAFNNIIINIPQVWLDSFPDHSNMTLAGCGVQYLINKHWISNEAGTKRGYLSGTSGNPSLRTMDDKLYNAFYRSNISNITYDYISGNVYDYLESNFKSDNPISAKDGLPRLKMENKLFKSDEDHVDWQWWYIRNGQYHHVVDGKHLGALEILKTDGVCPGIEPIQLTGNAGSYGVIPHKWIQTYIAGGSYYTSKNKYKNKFIKNMSSLAFITTSGQLKPVKPTDYGELCPKYYKDRWFKDDTRLSSKDQNYISVSLNVYNYLALNSGVSIQQETECKPTRKIYNQHHKGIEMNHYWGKYDNVVMMRAPSEQPNLGWRDWTYDKKTKQLRNLATGKCVDRHSGSPNVYGMGGFAADQYVVARECVDNNSAQKWTLHGENGYIQNDLNGDIMDTYGHSGNDRANVMRPNIDKPHRRWQFK
jgi:hypothetical protein